MRPASHLVALACAATATATAATAYPGAVSQRPQIHASPKSPRLPIPSPPPRNRTCFVQSHSDGITDDSSYIMSAFHECNDGGHVVFGQGQTYIIGTAMDWTFLLHIDIGVHLRYPLS